MTVSSLDAYLEPQRLSISSPPGSDHLPRIPSLDETFPVFSPPPQEFRDPDSSHTQTLMPSVVNNAVQTSPQSTRQHRRQSSLNTVSWPDQNYGEENGQRRRYSSTLNPSDVVIYLINFFF